jgi:hypothetical protein
MFLILGTRLCAESFRTIIAGTLEVTPENSAGSSVSLAYNDSCLIVLGKNARFLRGIELELSVPQGFLYYFGSLVGSIWVDVAEDGVNPDEIAAGQTAAARRTADMEGRQILYEPIPAKILSVYQIPLRSEHGMRPSPYAELLRTPVEEGAYPILYRIIPVIKGMDQEILAMRFQLTARPIIGDEGAVSVLLHYPDTLQNRPVTVFIDDKVVANPLQEMLLKEGEHQISIISSDYRNESSRFVVERAKVQAINVVLKDTKPVFMFEAPEQALIYVDNALITRKSAPYPVEQGRHEVKIQMSDYSVTKAVYAQKGKTYKMSFMMDLTVSESD